MKRHKIPDGPELELGSAEELEGELAHRRQLDDARRADELACERATAQHTRDRADVAEQARMAELERAEREEQARADAELARMYRTFRASGERTRITSNMARSGEARALRLERLRALNLKVLVPVLVGFALWSTAGVHHGAARLIGVGAGEVSDPMWWALWLLEPVLIGAVVWIIIVRARLAACGGTLNDQAVALAYGCLGTSVLLNFSAAIPQPGHHSSVWAIVGSMIAHGIAPIGAAMTAHLIGVVDESIADADPWTENGRPVPLLAEMDLRFGSAVESTSRTAVEAALEAGAQLAIASPATLWPLPVGERDLLPVIVGPKGAEGGRRTGGDRAGRRSAKAPGKPRPNKGVPVPPSARKPAGERSPRALSDTQLRMRLDALVEAGQLPRDPSYRQVQSALGIGFERAKRVLGAQAAREADGPGRVELTVMSRRDENEANEEVA